GRASPTSGTVSGQSLSTILLSMNFSLVSGKVLNLSRVDYMIYMKRILIVEHDDSIKSGLENILRNEGYEIRSAKSIFS
ncbi:MAG: hypothetical protein ACREBU_11010, partial [Nitrososphaera sp.]